MFHHSEHDSTRLPKSSLLSPHQGQLPSSGAGYTAAAITHPDRWKNSEICNHGRTPGNTIFTSANFEWGESSSTGFSRCEEKTGKPGDLGEDGLSAISNALHCMVSGSCWKISHDLMAEIDFIAYQF